MIIRVVYIGNAADALKLCAVLGADFEVTPLRTADAVLRIREGSAELAIAAVERPWQDGLRRLGELQRAAAAAGVPVLALVPREHPDALVKAFEFGVADCAALPCDPGETAARVRALLKRKSVQDQLSAEARAARQAAFIDPVTGLFNRRHLDEALETAASAARLRGTPLAVLMLDIDAFKPVNDRFGHAFGDHALRAIGAWLSANVRSIDLVARYGGDEIVVVMPETNLATARHVAERLRRHIGASPVPAVPLGEARRLTVSIGVAALDARDADGAALLARADAALYAAKRAGRNRVESAADAA